MPTHETVLGMTRSGKSVYAQASALRWPGPVLFFNPQGQKMDLGSWTLVTPRDSLSDLLQLMTTKRARVNFVPTWHPDQARRELGAIVARAMQRIWTPPLLVVVDEADQVAPQGKIGTPAHQIAQRGGKQQVWGMFVTQHPAVLSKVIIRQTMRKTVFMLEDNNLDQYFMPAAEIDKILTAAPKYSYVVWEGKQLTGPFLEKL